MKKIKVRFHLAKGENFMHWQVKYDDNTIKYFDPSKFQLVMFGVGLKNQRGTAEKICYEGENKTVCAWIECEEIVVSTIIDKESIVSEIMQIRYNPRVNPFWMNWLGDNIDNVSLQIVKSVGNKLFVTQK